VKFGILGPLEVTEGDRPVGVGGARARTLLAALLVRANRVVPIDRLTAALWPDAGPSDEANALHTHLWRLRASLGGPGRIEREGAGYVLRCATDELDALAFEQAAAEARAALAAGRWAEAAASAAEALGWWRGDALADFAGEPFAAPRAAQLREARLGVVECGVDARLALGGHRELVGELRDLVAREPLSESLWAKLMVALYRSGRQAEALRTFDRVRTMLAEETGLSPGAELVRLERQVLDHDPALDWRPAPGPAGGAAAGAAAVPASALVTLLFTDVEHSTARWDRDPGAMGDALRRHDAAVRAALAAHGGDVFGHPGDGFCAAFARPTDAVAAALDIQRRLAALDWGGHDPLDVRVAVNTGEAEQRDGNWFGATVNRAARLRDAAHGGQVLVSETTRGVVVDAPPAGTDLVDLGTWLFEGFSRAERVYQLRDADLPAAFPPLRSGRPHTGAIPRHATSFVGRPAEVARVTALLADGQLVTITGEGGLGKTRLALEVARRAGPADYPDGVWFCDVTSVHDPQGLVEHVADALRLATPAGTDARGGLLDAVAGSRLLLIVDNCESMLDAVAPLVDELVAAGPDFTVLATSRAPLRARGEHVMPLDPLGLPGGADDEDGGPAPAVQLLVDRARAAGATVLPATPALGDIVTRLDGVPLAIELAAPRLATMSPAAVAARLDRSFELLAPGPAGAPARHRTLRATVDWSFQLLGADARRLFAALAVFRHGWTLDTAERVAPAVGLDEASTAPLMADLVEQSMVRIELPTEGTARYDMLAAIRDYAADYLAEIGASAAVADRHAAYFLELVEQAVPHRRGPREPAWVRGLEVEFANLRAAYEWLVASGQLGDALRLVSALVDDVLMRERLEIGRWAEELVALDAITPEPLRGVAQALAGNTAMVEGRLDDARRLSADALAAPGPDPCWIAHNTLGLLAAAGGDEAGWRGHMAAMEAASRASGDPMAAAVADFDRALIASLRGRRGDAAGPARSLLSLAAGQANPSLRAMALLSQARTFGPGDDERAGAVLREALAAARSAHNTLLTQQALRAIGELNARGGDRPAALEALRRVTRRFGESGNVAEQHQTIISMLDPLVAMGEFTAAATICGALSSTPWHNTFTYRTIDKTVGDRLDRDRHLAARRAGQAMSPADLVLYTSRLVRELR
jgi:predicted ATPase/DNA-binding SARP family transcriptional activator